MFSTDIRAIVPQLAMSAGTMIACSCDEIWMGKQSSLGPIDPQFGVIAAANLLEVVQRAFTEITQNPGAVAFWNPILGQLTPSFLVRCEHAVKDFSEFLKKTLTDGMLRGTPVDERNEIIERVETAFANTAGKAHNTHFNAQTCLDAGLKVKSLEDDQTFQDLVLTIHHCYMHSLGNTPAIKITENQLGRRVVKIVSFDPSDPS